MTVQVQDSSTPAQTASRQFSLVIDTAVQLPTPTGRNDSIATATALTTGGNRCIIASISPFTGTGADEDFYELTAAAGTVVTVEVFARRFNPSSGLDSVLEILQANDTRFMTCREGGDGSTTGAVNGVNGNPDTTPMAFDDPCLNDDIELGEIRDSKMEFQVPGSGSVTFFVRVLDWRGDARPDFRYDLKISGAN